MKILTKNRNNVGHILKGFSLVEMLVVVSIFVILGVLATQSLVLTFRGSRKGDEQTSVKENLSYTASIIQRHLYNSREIECPDNQTIRYLDEYEQGPWSTFTCIDVDGPGGNTGYVASNSARLTDPSIDIVSCTFNCIIGGGSDVTDSVNISLTAEDDAGFGIEGSLVELNTRVSLRQYEATQ